MKNFSIKEIKSADPSTSSASITSDINPSELKFKVVVTPPSLVHKTRLQQSSSSHHSAAQLTQYHRATLQSEGPISSPRSSAADQSVRYKLFISADELRDAPGF